MQDHVRRSFVKSALAGAAVAAVGSALSRSALAENIQDVKFAKDPTKLQAGAEAAHTPLLALEKLESTGVAFGKTPPGEFYKVTVQARHEATRDHQIFGIALYLNGELVAEHTMNQAQAEASLPTVAFVQRLKSGDALLAVTSCNLHGKWGNRLMV
ncbi:desulfoferrodoxin family protein [Noviherbaspirillum sp.]|jgi:desulfoferrodoxin (superoxide reductase-like protein)|uniref:desulfoferrodoxin family protein n=1 Tax=Noviherbaspirillum sp. TaxID=1926288 RepID=UPI0025F9790E|nr:desulfoferrodoxin family protein [Noviherbaspirillum sp.]